MTNREIAARLYVSTRTVETHVDHILTKLGLSTRTQLVARAHEGGLPPRQEVSLPKNGSEACPFSVQECMPSRV